MKTPQNHLAYPLDGPTWYAQHCRRIRRRRLVWNIVRLLVIAVALYVLAWWVVILIFGAALKWHGRLTAAASGKRRGRG